MQTELTTHLILLGVFTLIAFALLLGAKRFKLLQIPKEPSYSNVSGFLVAIAFVLYLGFFKVIAPIILLIGMKARVFILDISTTVLVNLAFIWAATLLITLLTMVFGAKSRKAVWAPRDQPFSSRLFAVALSPVYYIIAFPWIFVVSELYLVAGFIIYGEAPPVVEQSMVTFLKQIVPFPVLFALTAFTIVVIVPIQEEILFRGLLQRWLSKRCSILYSILISSLLFSVLHYGSEQGFSNFMLLPTLFCFSLFLGLVYEKLGSLWASIALHGLFNGISILLLITNWTSAG